MTYRLIDHTGRDADYFSSLPAAYDTDFEAVSDALALGKIEIYNGNNVHLSVVDDRQRRLYEIKVARRKKARK